MNSKSRLLKICFQENISKDNAIYLILDTSLNLQQIQNLKINDTCLNLAKQAITKNIFNGEYEKLNLFTYLDEEEIKYLVLVGAGRTEELTNYKLEKLGAMIYNHANSLKLQSISVISQQQNTNSISIGARLSGYTFNKYLTKKIENTLEEMNIISKDKNILEYDEVINSIFLARDYVNEPANKLYPDNYAKLIAEELEKFDIDVEIIGEREIDHLGMNALLGVGQGSNKESKVVVMKYYGLEDKNTPPLAFVGKGVTFDSGGISLKPSEAMKEMKKDMAGSAVVVGLIRALAAMKTKINVVGVVGLAENMLGGNAQKVGDVVATMSGKTVEILNTDAEGRLILADILWYTQDKFKPQLMIDLATLTGAIAVALGSTYAGCFSNNEELAERLLKAGAQVEEKLWRMPLHEDYDKMIKSPIADLCNISTTGSGTAGSSTASQFLQNFVNNVPWAHLDIAGVSSDKNPLSKGATGFGVRLLYQLIKDYYENK